MTSDKPVNRPAQQTALLERVDVDTSKLEEIDREIRTIGRVMAGEKHRPYTRPGSKVTRCK